MGIPKYSKRQLYGAIANTRNIIGLLPSDYPLNLIQISRDIGLHVDSCPFKTPGLRGILIIDDNLKGHIVLDSKRHSDEQNFFCGHEIIHYTCHMGAGHTSFQCYEKIRKQQNVFAEWQANEEAAELLVPYMLFIPDLLDAFDPLHPTSNMWFARKLLSEKYRVSEQVIKNRVESLKYEILQVARGTAISDIEITSKAQLEHNGISIKSCNALSDEKMYEEDSALFGYCDL